MVRNICISLCCIVASLTAAALDTMTGIFDNRFATLRAIVNDDVLSFPVITLGGDDVLEISFDELADDRSYLRAQLMHCTASWQPSQLVEVEYVEGFNQADIDTYEYSRATTVPYVHYSITIPNRDLMPLVSGNYLLQVYDEDDPDTVLLQQRFMVNEGVAAVTGNVMGVTDIDYNREHQQLSIAVNLTDADVFDPFNDLRVVVSQNGRLDNEVALTHPMQVRGPLVVYEHMPQLIFKGGNEYRRMETVSTIYPSMNIADVDYYYPYYHATVNPSVPRADEPYYYDSTQHGRYVVREYNAVDSDTEADYLVTHFLLEMPQDPTIRIFLDGDFVYRRFSPESEMIYNPETGYYEHSMLLKQGAYNYQYLAVKDGHLPASTAEIEGDHYRTANEYHIKVYTRRRGERYDRLIGTATIQFK